MGITYKEAKEILRGLIGIRSQPSRTNTDENERQAIALGLAAIGQLQDSAGIADDEEIR